MAWFDGYFNFVFYCSSLKKIILKESITKIKHIRCLRKNKIWLGLDPQAIQIIKTESGLKQLARTQVIIFCSDVEIKL